MFTAEANYEVTVRRGSKAETERKIRKIKRVGNEAKGPISTRMDTIEVNAATLSKWLTPFWQRPVIITTKVREASEQIRQTGVIPGVLTIGEFDDCLWRVDCQHRLAAFEMSGRASALADVRFAEFDGHDMMADEYDALNAHLVQMRPDYKMKALELKYEQVRILRENVPFVGYDKVRHESTTAPMLGMCSVLRNWFGAATPTPVSDGKAPRDLAEQLTSPEADFLIEFLNLAYESWGRESDYSGLWKKLNLTLCMWIFRTCVSGQVLKPHERRMGRDIFAVGLRSLKDAGHLDWLRGRTMCERDRGPTYIRIKRLMTSACKRDGERISLPDPPWAGG